MTKTSIAVPSELNIFEACTEVFTYMKTQCFSQILALVLKTLMCMINFVSQQLVGTLECSGTCEHTLAGSGVPTELLYFPSRFF